MSDFDIFLSDAKRLVDSEFELLQHPIKLPVIFVGELNGKFFEIHVGKKKTWYQPGQPFPDTDRFKFVWIKEPSKLPNYVFRKLRPINECILCPCTYGPKPLI
jgi:hypothetical protein